VELGAAQERVRALSRLFKYEFMFRSDAPFERIFEEEVLAMERDDEIARVVLPQGGVPAIEPKGDDGRAQTALYARLLENFVQGYRVAARGLTTLLRAPLASKDVVKRSLTIGNRMFLAGEISKPEAVSRTLIENAYSSFADQGYLFREGGKLGLAESYATASAVATIESRIAAMATPSSDKAG
jgi:glycerol-3-phosphate O-acyltransferase